MKTPAVFLDRDGTIIRDTHYLNRIEDICLYDFSAEAIKKLNELAIPVIVVTNQSGVARGLFSENDIQQIHEYLNNLLKKQGAYIDAFYYCPHHIQGILPEYSYDCSCRKPKIGMIEKALRDFPDIDLSNSYVVGDKMVDVNLAHNAGCKAILVRTGHGEEEVESSSINPCDCIAENLGNAVDIIIKDFAEFLE